jgi:hypothetical protein
MSEEIYPTELKHYQVAAIRIVEMFGVWFEPFEKQFKTTTHAIMFLKVFAEPGINKSELIVFLHTVTGVSLSTAERLIKDAKDADYLSVSTTERHGSPWSISVSEKLSKHCVTYLQARAKDPVKIDYSTAPPP